MVAVTHLGQELRLQGLEQPVQLGQFVADDGAWEAVVGFGAQFLNRLAEEVQGGCRAGLVFGCRIALGPPP